MNLQDITAKAWILALFKRDDGERFLLGDGYYDFKESLQHFSANSIANDIVELQGADGQLLAGQVKRATTQSFDGFIGDGLTSKAEVEFRRRAFLQFFQVRHFYDVIYVFCDGTAIIRKRGFLVDAPEVPEIRQMSPSYHVALNFEDANYYEYAEDGLGDEVFANTVKVAFSNAITGGLVWDEDGAVSNNFQIIYSDQISASGNPISFSIDTEYGGKIEELKLNGNAEQTTYSGKNLITLTGKTLGGSGSVIDSQTANSIRLTVGNNMSAYSNRNVVFELSELGLSVGDTITVSSKISGTYSGANGASIRVYWDSTSAIPIPARLSKETKNATLTVPSGATKVQFYFYIAQGTIPSGSDYAQFDELQLEKSATFTSFEPYVGGTASPNPDYPQDINVVTGEQNVEVVGKNLFNVNVTPSSYTNTTTSISGDTITVTSNSNAQTARVDLPFVFEANRQMTISFDAKFIQNDAGDSLISQVCLRTPGTSDTTGATYLTKTIGQTNHYSTVVSAVQSNNNTRQLWLYVKANALAGAVKVEFSNIQIEYGSATTYEPYQEQTLPVNLGGSNLFSFDNATLSQYPTSGLDSDIEANSVTITSETTTGAQVQYATFTGSFDANKTYTLSGKGKKIVKGTDGQSRLQINWRGSNDNGSTWSNYTNIFQQPDPVQGVEYSFSGHFTGYTSYQFLFYNNSSTPVSLGEKTTYYDIMLNEGSGAIPFVPYTTYQYELAKIGTYQDYIWNDNGTWKVHKAVRHLSLPVADMNSINDYPGWISDTTAIIRTDLGTGLNAQLNTVTSYISNVKTGDTGYGINTKVANKTLWANRTDFGGLTQTQWQANYPNLVFELYYGILEANQYDTTITEQTLIDQLNAVANAQLYSGQNNIMNIAVSPNLAGELEIGYVEMEGYDYTDSGYVFEEGTGGGATTIYVQGIADALPVWVVNGEATNPTLTNVTTGQSITWTGTVPAGQSLTIDMENQTATLAGANVFSGISGDWVELKVGTNMMTYYANGDDIKPSQLNWSGVVG